MNAMTRTMAACLILAGIHGTVYAIDSVSAEFAVADEIRMARVGAQWKWQQRWWESDGSHIGGFWDLSLAQWRGSRFQSRSNGTQHLTSIGITPVIRLQNNNLKGFYVEGGIGIHYLSDLYDNNDRQLSTRFQFGDHISIGYVFQNNLDLSLKVQHFSNGSIKQPNDGVNFAVVRVSYPLE